MKSLLAMIYSKKSFLTVFISIFLILSPSVIFAAKPGFQNLVNNGKKEYLSKNYIKANEYFLKALEIKKDPKLYFNIAQSYRLSGKLAEALLFYELFLKNIEKTGLPPVKAKALKKEVSGFIKEIKDTIEKEKNEKEMKEKEKELFLKKQEEEKRRKIDEQKSILFKKSDHERKNSGITSQWWFWAGTGTAIALTAMTATFGFMALKANDEWESSWKSTDKDKVLLYRNLTDIFLAGSVLTGIAVGAGIYFFNGNKEVKGTVEKATYSIFPVLSPQGMALTFNLNW